MSRVAAYVGVEIDALVTNVRRLVEQSDRMMTRFSLSKTDVEDRVAIDRGRARLAAIEASLVEPLTKAALAELDATVGSTTRR